MTFENLEGGSNISCVTSGNGGKQKQGRQKEQVLLQKFWIMRPDMVTPSKTNTQDTHSQEQAKGHPHEVSLKVYRAVQSASQNSRQHVSCWKHTGTIK